MLIGATGGDGIRFTTMKSLAAAAALGTAFQLSACAPDASTVADIVLLNGQIFTADLTVLSQDIFAVPVPELPKTQSVLTMAGGRIVHEPQPLR